MRECMRPALHIDLRLVHRRKEDPGGASVELLAELYCRGIVYTSGDVYTAFIDGG